MEDRLVCRLIDFFQSVRIQHRPPPADVIFVRRVDDATRHDVASIADAANIVPSSSSRTTTRRTHFSLDASSFVVVFEPSVPLLPSSPSSSSFSSFPPRPMRASSSSSSPSTTTDDRDGCVPRYVGGDRSRFADGMPSLISRTRTRTTASEGMTTTTRRATLASFLSTTSSRGA